MISKTFLKNIEKRLLEEKRNILLKYLQNDDIDSDGDETDKIQANIELDMQKRFLGLNKGKINLIEMALERIGKNTYGICVDCEEPIAEKRLLANPYYITCISCAEDREKEERRKGN